MGYPGRETEPSEEPVHLLGHGHKMYQPFKVGWSNASSCGARAPRKVRCPKPLRGFPWVSCPQGVKTTRQHLAGRQECGGVRRYSLRTDGQPIFAHPTKRLLPLSELRTVCFGVWTGGSFTPNPTWFMASHEPDVVCGGASGFKGVFLEILNPSVPSKRGFKNPPGKPKKQASPHKKRRREKNG